MKPNSAKDPIKTVIRHHVDTDFECCYAQEDCGFGEFYFLYPNQHDGR